MQTCVNCVMDTTDPNLTFNNKGVCNYCQNFNENIIDKYWKPGSKESLAKLDTIIAEIKETQKNKEYDAIIGVSGGVDSSYLLYWATKIAKLRLLAVHVDAGWNSELAVKNIESLVRNLGIDLYTHVVNWEAMKDVHLAFLKSGVANQDIPQDHAFVASIFEFVSKHNIKYVLNGCNIATESVLPTAWGHDSMDSDQIKDICKKFGAKHLKDFPLMSFFKFYHYYPKIKKIEHISPLNYIVYDKPEAIRFLEKEMGWRYYGGKHYESRFTKFFQGYWLPTKFGYDKRKAHLSSLILSGQTSRQEALEELKKPPILESELKHDIIYIAKKLDISNDELMSYLHSENKTFHDYANNLNKKEAYYRFIQNIDNKLIAVRIIIDKIKFLFFQVLQYARRFVSKKIRSWNIF